MARKIIQKHSLTIPFDLDNLVNQYAKVIYKTIPINDVDGVCLNLKKPGKIPIVIVNQQSPRVRQRFTLAHELGHIIIPWHLGTFVDDIDFSKGASSFDNQYENIEKEANRFASELLMPFEWIYSLFKDNPDPEFLIFKVCHEWGVSEMAARIRVNNALDEIKDLLLPQGLINRLFQEDQNLARLQTKLKELTPYNSSYIAKQMAQFLPGRIAYCVEKGNKVISCGSTSKTHPFFQQEGITFISSPYPFYKNYHIHHNSDGNTHWWTLDVNFRIENDNRSWKELLNEIVSDLVSPEETSSFRNMINGKISGINGSRKKKTPDMKINEFIDDVIHRFNNFEYHNLIRHPIFLIFIKKRCEDLF